MVFADTSCIPDEPWPDHDPQMFVTLTDATSLQSLISAEGNDNVTNCVDFDQASKILVLSSSMGNLINFSLKTISDSTSTFLLHDRSCKKNDTQNLDQLAEIEFSSYELVLNNIQSSTIFCDDKEKKCHAHVALTPTSTMVEHHSSSQASGWKKILGDEGSIVGGLLLWTYLMSLFSL
jgi:hypothetical protein